MKYRLGDICSITKGATGIMKAVPGPYPMVTLSEERKAHDTYQFDAKAVIVPLISSTGHGHASLKRVHYQEGKFALGSILCAVIPHDENQLNPRYLYIYLQQFKDTLLVPLMKGAANVSLPLGRLAGVEIEVPSPERQVQLIALHDQLEAQLVELHQLFAQQETDTALLRQALLREAMQGKLVPQDPADEPAAALLARIRAEKAARIKAGTLRKEKPLPPITEAEMPYPLPEGWGWCRLGSITSLITSGSRDWAQHYSSKGATFVRMGNLSKGSFALRMQNVQYVKPPLGGEGDRTSLEKGDILVSITGEVGWLGLIPSGFGEAYINQHTALVRLLDGLLPEFGAYCFLSPFLQQQFNAPQRGLKNSFRLSDVDNLLIPLPPLAEQQRIVTKLEQVLAQCEALAGSIGQSRAQAEALLRAALREALAPPAAGVAAAAPRPQAQPGQQLALL